MGRAAEAEVVVRSRKKGEKIYKDLQADLDRLGKKVKTFGLIAGAAAVGGVAALTVKGLQNVDALAKQSDLIGTTTEKLAALRHLTVLTGGATDALDKSLFKATKALGEFNITGSGTAAPILRKLNLDTKALAELRPDELFARYAEEIRKMTSRADQAAATSLLFSDRTGQMLNLIDAGAGALANAEEEVVKYGVALNRVDSAKVEAANDAMFRVQQRVSGLGNILASKFAPLITAVANRFLETGSSAEEMGATIDRVIDGIAVGVGILMDAFFGWKLLFGAIRVEMLQGAANMVGALARIEMAGTHAGNTIREAFGKATFDPDKGFIREIELSLAASAEHAHNQFQALAASEKPSIALGRAMSQARIDSEASAQARAREVELLQDLNVPTFDGSLVDDTAAARAEAQLAKQKETAQRQLEQVQASLMERETLEAVAFANRLEVVKQNEDLGLLNEVQAQNLRLQLFQKFQEKLTDIEVKGMTERQKFQAKSGKDQAKDVFSTLETISAGVAGHNKAMFRLNQAAAIANAIINTYQGVTKTLAAYPMPIAGILAAAHLAAGLAQVSAIRSAQFGGGTTPSLAGSTPTFNDQPVSRETDQQQSQAQGNVIQIIVQGSLVGDQGLKDVLAETFRDLTDQDVVFMSPNSRQAIEIRTGGTGTG